MKLIEKMRARSLDVVVAVLIVLIGAAPPWGAAGRPIAPASSSSAWPAGSTCSMVGATAAKLWLAMPLVVAVVVVAAGTGRRGLAVVVGTVLAVFAVGLVAATYRSPLLPRYGLPVTMAGAGHWRSPGWSKCCGAGRPPTPTERGVNRPNE